ncbi:hypothetical protein [Hespellia stercorisuis]|uniref:Uncharacterized protein n=1 Tax=Hespellia stercorisuis DSM 15480 TaxID=1121950 RepID=A0A1M6VYR1_9FIRM|nr:hypothetical protein [Hespellia stercorisuis]SHK86455.1 hypothetical protein SAMN02745243_03890 [Hespellia stercorisuis DSM 15480]
MLTLIFVIMMFVVFGKLIMLAIRATWGITKVLFTVVFLPVILICMVVGGLVSVALPILVVIGVVALIGAER